MQMGAAVVVVLTVLGAWAGESIGAETAVVAGTQPDRRPEGAPVAVAPTKDQAWYTRALRGVEGPPPPSLRWLEDQGGWYTPFYRPGMTGPYDIRGLHQP